jgi:hypothetical protein
MILFFTRTDPNDDIDPIGLDFRDLGEIPDYAYVYALMHLYHCFVQHRTGTFLGAHELDKDTYLPTYTLIAKAVASARDEERFVERRRELLQKGLARLGIVTPPPPIPINRAILDLYNHDLCETFNDHREHTIKSVGVMRHQRIRHRRKSF